MTKSQKGTSHSERSSGHISKSSSSTRETRAPGEGAERNPSKNEVRAVMTPHVVAVTAVTFLPEAAQIMLSEDVGALPVVNDTGKLLGIITDRDIAVRAVAEGMDVRNTQVAEVFSTEALVTVGPEADIHEVRDLMAEHQVRRIPIVEPDYKLVGMVSLADLRDHPNAAGQVLKDICEPGGEHCQ